MAELLNIAICEDTKLEEENLLKILDENPIPTSCEVFHSGEELLEVYEIDKFDLLLMDIYMDGITGVEAVSKIREVDKDVPVAFVTTSTDHTLESYRLSVLKYIEKPFKNRDIEEILQLALMKKKNAPSLKIKINGKEEYIKLSKILYLEQQKHLVHIHLKNEEVIDINEKLINLVSQLEGHNFFVSHKSFIVNLAYVCSIDLELKCFSLINGQNVPIRRESMADAKKELGNFLFRQTRGD